ncbi:MAG: hypothetical protein RBQ97_03665 [Acholeplasma sp.]|nr:hypothetical protein [Acholeplasma sp.]
MSETKKQLLLKIKALAENGTDGEKVNAQKLLSELMTKYGISDAELELNKREWRDVTLPRFRLHNKLFWQIIMSTYDITKYRKTNKRDVIKLEITHSEHLEILARYEFYVHYFDIDIDAYLHAFCSKNKLFPKTKASGNPRQLTERQYQKLLRAQQLSDRVNKYQYGSNKLSEQLKLDFNDIND